MRISIFFFRKDYLYLIILIFTSVYYLLFELFRYRKHIRGNENKSKFAFSSEK